MEVEAKFLAPPAVFVELRELAAIGPFLFAPDSEPETQRNIYYDTADQRMRAGRYGLRVRHIGSRQIATLKSAATLNNGVYTRGEWEQDVPGDDPRTWPEGELRARVLALIGDAPLQPILEIQTSRQHIYATNEGERFAEISLDEGEFIADERREHFQELEIELLPGADRANFDVLVQLLRTRFPLTPEPRSKLERGLKLR